MICQYCGQQIADNVSFCTNCGARLVGADAPGTGSAPVSGAPSFGTPDFGNAQRAGATPPVGTPDIGAPAASMPNTTTAMILIVVGFLCGIIWGIIGIIQYGPMKTAIELGDAETAQKKFRIITIATAIGVVLNVFAIIGMFAG